MYLKIGFILSFFFFPIKNDSLFMVSPIRICLLLLLMFCLRSPRHITWTGDVGRNIYLGPTTSHTKFSALNLSRPSLCPQHLHTRAHPQQAYMRSCLTSILERELCLIGFYLHFFSFILSSLCYAKDFKVLLLLLLDFTPLLFPLNHPYIFTRSAYRASK